MAPASAKMETEIKELKWNLQVPKSKVFPYNAKVLFTDNKQKKRTYYYYEMLDVLLA